MSSSSIPIPITLIPTTNDNDYSPLHLEPTSVDIAYEVASTNSENRHYHNKREITLAGTFEENADTHMAQLIQYHGLIVTVHSETYQKTLQNRHYQVADICCSTSSWTMTETEDKKLRHNWDVRLEQV